MSLTELIDKIHELSPEDLEFVRRELDVMDQAGSEETPEMLAALDEGLRSLRQEPTLTLEELEREMKTWTTGSK